MLFRSNDTATTEIYTRKDTLSLHDALPIYFGVNSGPKNATRIVQRAINRLSKKDIVVEVDGALGPETLRRVMAVDPALLVESMLKERAVFYGKLVAQNPSQEVFLKGWMNRLHNVTEEVQEFMS